MCDLSVAHASFSQFVPAKVLLAGSSFASFRSGAHGSGCRLSRLRRAGPGGEAFQRVDDCRVAYVFPGLFLVLACYFNAAQAGFL